MNQSEHSLARLSPYWVGSLFYGLYWGAIGIYEPFLNVHFQRLGLTGFEMGILNALLPLAILVFSPLISALADRRAWRRSILLACCLGLGIGMLLLAPQASFGGVLATFALVAFARGPTAPIGDALVLRIATRNGIDYGRMRLWGSFFFAGLSIVFGFVWQAAGMRWMFPATALGFGLLALVILPMEEGQPVRRESRFPWRIFWENKMLLALFIAALMMGASTMIFIFSNLYMSTLGGGELEIGLLLGATAMAEVPMMHFGGGWMRKIGSLGALLLGLVLDLVAFLIGIFAGSPWVLILSAALNGAGFGLSFVAIVVTFDRYAPDNWSASIQSLVNAGMLGAAPFLSSFILGTIYDRWPAGMYVFAAGLILAGIAAVLAAMRIDARG